MWLYDMCYTGTDPRFNINAYFFKSINYIEYV